MQNAWTRWISPQNFERVRRASLPAIVNTFQQVHIDNKTLPSQWKVGQLLHCTRKETSMTQVIIDLSVLPQLCANYWSKALQEGNPIDAVYLDFSKAFDKVPHKRLLTKLESYGIRGEVLGWIANFLDGRKQSWSAI